MIPHFRGVTPITAVDWPLGSQHEPKAVHLHNFSDVLALFISTLGQYVVNVSASMIFDLETNEIAARYHLLLDPYSGVIAQLINHPV